jgi:hypothetical protein
MKKSRLKRYSAIFLGAIIVTQCADAIAQNCGDAYARAVDAVTRLYIQPLGLHDAKISVRTEMHRWDGGPERVWIIVDTDATCGRGQSDSKPLLEVYFYMPEGRLEGLTAQGALLGKRAVTEVEREARISAASAIVSELAGWTATNRTPGISKDGNRLRVYFRDRDATDETRTYASFDRRTGILVLAGVP